MLGFGGLGYGAVFSGTLNRLTSTVTGRHAPDISGLFNTASRVGGVIGVAVVGTIYLALAPSGGHAPAVHAFTVVTLALAATALTTTLSAHLSSRDTTPPSRET